MDIKGIFFKNLLFSKRRMYISVLPFAIFFAIFLLVGIVVFSFLVRRRKTIFIQNDIFDNKNKDTNLEKTKETNINSDKKKEKVKSEDTYLKNKFIEQRKNFTPLNRKFSLPVGTFASPTNSKILTQSQNNSLSNNQNLNNNNLANANNNFTKTSNNLANANNNHVGANGININNNENNLMPSSSANVRRQPTTTLQTVHNQPQGVPGNDNLLTKTISAITVQNNQPINNRNLNKNTNTNAVTSPSPLTKTTSSPSPSPSTETTSSPSPSTEMTRSLSADDSARERKKMYIDYPLEKMEKVFKDPIYTKNVADGIYEGLGGIQRIIANSESFYERDAIKQAMDHGHVDFRKINDKNTLDSIVYIIPGNVHGDFRGETFMRSAAYVFDRNGRELESTVDHDGRLSLRRSEPVVQQYENGRYGIYTNSPSMNDTGDQDLDLENYKKGLDKTLTNIGKTIENEVSKGDGNKFKGKSIYLPGISTSSNSMSCNPGYDSKYLNALFILHILASDNGMLQSCIDNNLIVSMSLLKNMKQILKKVLRYQENKKKIENAEPDVDIVYTHQDSEEVGM